MPTSEPVDVERSSQVERSADPRAAALTIERLTASVPGAAARLRADPGLQAAVVATSAASPWLARLCVNDPRALSVLTHLDVPVESTTVGTRTPQQSIAGLKQLEVLRIAARDLLGLDDLEEIGRSLAALADRFLAIAYDLTAETSAGLAVIGMGKLGACELNYASDIDILLVAPDDNTSDRSSPLLAVRPFVDLARVAWRVDLDLRPEGRSGSLVRTLGSYWAYWERWAQAWELQSLLKARPVAGDEALGKRFLELARQQVWDRPFGPDDLAEIRRMKARSEGEMSRRALADRELKRGRGGIRDIEFAIQLLQLVHGRSDPALHLSATLPAIAALARGGYIAKADAGSLEDAYRFLRTIEHRLQLYEGQQVHTLPSPVDRREHLARVMGYRDRPSATALSQFEADLRYHQTRARAIHQRLFFRPLLEVFTEGSGSLSPDAVATRLGAFGFTDAERTRQATMELTRGLTRSSQLMQQMLPVLLDWLSTSPDPDQGLLGLRTLAGEPHARDRLTALCRESPIAARELCELLGTGARFSRDLLRHPDAITGLARGDFLRARTREDLERRMERSLTWRSGPGAFELGLRQFYQREVLRIAASDVLGLVDLAATRSALSDLADAVIAAAVAATAIPFPLAVIGMGRLGGREMGYPSDVDLMLVYESPGASPSPDGLAQEAEATVAELIRIIGGTTPATGVYKVDLGLRPEGRQGPPARSLGAYAAYYERWAQPWERQALLRSRFVAGDADLGQRFAAVAHKFVWEQPFGDADEREIRRTKARIEKERVPAGDDPKFHLKLGPGSLSDIEWTAQLLQLRHHVPVTGTVEALEALADHGILAPEDCRVLLDSYWFCESTRNRLHLIRDVGGDSLPGTGRLLTTLSRSLATTGPGLRNEYSRRTRRARRVVERLFYGSEALGLG